MKRFFINFVLVVFLLLVAMAAGDPQNCHNLDTTTALQDFLRRWLAEENGANLWHFNILARRWQDPNFVSLNPCITFTVKSDVNLTANFEPVRPSEIEQAAEMLKEKMNQEIL